MSAPVRIQVRCPYCGADQQVVLPELFARPFVELCDPDEGGCDSYFAVKNVVVSASAEVVKIEGEG